MEDLNINIMENTEGCTKHSNVFIVLSTNHSMKLIRLLIIGLLALSIIQIVNAEEVILSPSKSAYNLGEQLTIIGDVNLGEANYTILTIYLTGGNGTKNELAKFNVQGRKALNIVQLNKGSPIPVNLADRVPGNYSVIGELEGDSGGVSRTISSPSFDLTDELKLTWSINAEAFTLGQEIRIAGAALLQDNSISGGITISVLNNTYKFNTGSFQIVEKLTKSYDQIDIQIWDAYNNYVKDNKSTQIFTSFKTDFSGSLTSAGPGEPFYIWSPIQYYNGESVEFEADLSVSGHTYTTKGTGKLEYKIDPPSDMIPGSHDLYIRVWDKYGNEVKKTMTLYLSRILDQLSISTDKTKYKARESVKFTASAKDQQGKPLAIGLNIKLVSESGETITSRSTNFGADGEVEGELLIPEESEGKWKVIVESAGKSSEKEITVRKGLFSGFGSFNVKAKPWLILFLILFIFFGWLHLERVDIIKQKPLSKSLKFIGLKIERVIGKELRWLANKLHLDKAAKWFRSHQKKKYHKPHVLHSSRKMKYSDLWKKPENKKIPKKIKASELLKDKKDDHHLKL